IIVPLDTSFTMGRQLAKVYNEKNGYVKISIEKLYDLSGTTYQKNGVQPHIQIPDLWSALYKGELEYSNALSNDPIEKKVKIEVVPDTKIKVCEDLSAERIKNDNQFKRTLTLSDTLKTVYGRTVYPLYPPKYAALIKRADDVEQLIDTVFAATGKSLNIKPTRNTAEV